MTVSDEMNQGDNCFCRGETVMYIFFSNQQLIILCESAGMLLFTCAKLYVSELITMWTVITLIIWK